MEELNRVRLELPLVLPDVDDPRDPCVDRLIGLLKGRPGVERVHVKMQQDSPPLLCLHYDPAVISVGRLRELVSAVGAQLTGKFAHYVGNTPAPLHARGARLFAERLRQVPGVLEAEVSPSGRFRIEYERSAMSQKRLEDLVRASGTELTNMGREASESSGDKEGASAHGKEDAHAHGKEEEHAHVHGKADTHAGHEHGHGGIFGEHTELIFAVAAGLFVLAGWLVERNSAAASWLPMALYLGAYLCGGVFTAKEAFENVLARRFEIDTLMLVAAIGAAALGKWAEGGLLLFLFSLGHSLEHFAMGRARRAIEALAKLAPETALLRKGDEIEEVPVEKLQPGDIVLVKPNERLPADGVVVKGTSSVNQAPVTGESVPVDKSPVEDGKAAIAAFERVKAVNRVFAGTINGTGAIDVMVARLASQSTMARVVQMVADAEAQRSPTQQFTDRFERIFVPVILGLVALLMLAFVVVDEAFSDSFYRAMAVLVAASPCALAISVPSAVLSGVARAGRSGVLVKGGGPLENLGSLDAIAFDKTGTLTEGRPNLTDVVTASGVSETELLAVVVAVESHSDHPLASALVQGGRERLPAGVPAARADDVRGLTGRGVQAVVDGETTYIAKPVLFAESNGMPLSSELARANDSLVRAGRTTMVVRKGSRFLGVIGVMDTPRAVAPAVMQQLRELGITRLVMLSGDNQQVADAVARTVGLTEAKGDLLPEQKVETVKNLRERHGKVAMVGDGVNDAPAMANATVGIAMGAAGSDVALEAADVALMSDDLSQLPFAVGLSRRTRRVIKQNLWVSLGVVAVLIPATIFGLNIGTAVLFHEGSTLVVVINALRLLAYSGTTGVPVPASQGEPKQESGSVKVSS
ncbi:heavy metal translocating P-type ATPase [Massilia sp. Bi118]|jgi:Cd2+/Zn2+-exporting ATPase|uniref:heavy metal translocating P-type ATPase n=1 Tax=Massilia sp. Bi118 TaxID=2822346 RepID=UPI001E33EDEC|nr:heavy metal translocating P-type ATPase [Massilia sp. Bi118]